MHRNGPLNCMFVSILNVFDDGAVSLGTIIWTLSIVLIVLYVCLFIIYVCA
jgi:hypothetical protein